MAGDLVSLAIGISRVLPGAPTRRATMELTGSESTSMEQRGATAVEYALLVTLIAVAIIGSLLLFGTGVAGLFDVDLSPGG